MKHGSKSTIDAKQDAPPVESSDNSILQSNMSDDTIELIIDERNAEKDAVVCNVESKHNSPDLFCSTKSRKRKVILSKNAVAEQPESKCMVACNAKACGDIGKTTLTQTPHMRARILSKIDQSKFDQCKHILSYNT